MSRIVKAGSPRKNSTYVVKRLRDAKPCPTCYAPMIRERGGWVCEGFAAHRFKVKEAA